MTEVLKTVIPNSARYVLGGLAYSVDGERGNSAPGFESSEFAIGSFPCLCVSLCVNLPQWEAISQILGTDLTFDHSLVSSDASPSHVDKLGTASLQSHYTTNLVGARPH